MIPCEERSWGRHSDLVGSGNNSSFTELISMHIKSESLAIGNNCGFDGLLRVASDSWTKISRKTLDRLQYVYVL